MDLVEHPTFELVRDSLPAYKNKSSLAFVQELRQTFLIDDFDTIKCKLHALQETLKSLESYDKAGIKSSKIALRKLPKDKQKEAIVTLHKQFDILTLKIQLHHIYSMVEQELLHMNEVFELFYDALSSNQIHHAHKWLRKVQSYKVSAYASLQKSETITKKVSTLEASLPHAIEH